MGLHPIKDRQLPLVVNLDLAQSLSKKCGWWLLKS